MLMNSAPAELLQLLTFAALQLQSFLKLGNDEYDVPVRCSHHRLALTRKEKAAMPEQDQAVRLIFFVEVKCISV